jgi:hypothetical protein
MNLTAQSLRGLLAVGSRLVTYAVEGYTRLLDEECEHKGLERLFP